MANNTIGTGAVVLTANADALLTGLDKAGAATDKWAKKTAGNLSKSLGDPTDAANRKAYEKGAAKGMFAAGYMADVNYVEALKQKADKAGKDAEKSKGGLLGKLLFGAGVGTVLAGVGLALGAANRLADVGERSQRYSNVGTEKQTGIDRADKAFFRISAVADDFLFKIAGDLAPAIERVASVLEVVGYVGAEVFGEGVRLVGEIVDEVTRWVDETFGLATATTSAGDQAFAVLRIIGKGIAYFYDLNKGVAGVIAFTAGVIVDGFGQVIQVIAEATRMVAKLAAELPEAIRPDWAAKAADAVDGFGKKVEGVGEKMQKWGKNAVNGFGSSAGDVDAFFNKVEGKFKSSDRLAKSFGNLLSGAFTQNSAEAYSVIAKFRAGNIVTGQTSSDPVAVAKKGVEEQKKTNRVLYNIQQIVGTIVPPKELE